MECYFVPKDDMQAFFEEAAVIFPYIDRYLAVSKEADFLQMIEKIRESGSHSQIHLMRTMVGIAQLIEPEDGYVYINKMLMSYMTGPGNNIEETESVVVKKVSGPNGIAYLIGIEDSEDENDSDEREFRKEWLEMHGLTVLGKREYPIEKRECSEEEDL